MHWKKWIHDYPWSLHGHVVWNTKFFWWKRNALSSKLELNKTDSINASAARIYDGCRPHSRASEHGRTECEAGVIDTLHYTGWRDSCSWRLFPAGLFEGFFFFAKDIQPSLIYHLLHWQNTIFSLFNSFSLSILFSSPKAENTAKTSAALRIKSFCFWEEFSKTS